MKNSLLKPFLVSPQILEPAARAALFSQGSMPPIKTRLLTELGGIIDEVRGKDFKDEFHPLHPSLAQAIREKQVRLSAILPIHLEPTLEAFTEEMLNVHAKRPHQVPDYPCDFNETCLLTAVVGDEVQSLEKEIQGMALRQRGKVMPRGLMVAHHFSLDKDLALLAVRRMFGQDGQHLSGSSRHHYENFFPGSAW